MSEQKKKKEEEEKRKEKQDTAKFPYQFAHSYFHPVMIPVLVDQRLMIRYLQSRCKKTSEAMTSHYGGQPLK
jgi:hypothetical protein